MFEACHYAVTVANNGTVLLTMQKGGISMPHLLYDVATGGNATFRLIEGGTITGGTALAAYNYNRSSTAMASGTVLHSGTLAGGTVIKHRFIPGGSGGTKQGGDVRSSNEVVGLTSLDYTAEVVNISGGSVPVSIGVSWYEEDED